jgi:MSHA biogenesis protein MshK
MSAGLIFSVCMSQAQANDTDPTRPLGYEQSSGEGISGSGQSSIKLSSILFSSDRKIAIINGQQLRENQTIKGIGAQVKKIDAGAVTLQQGNKTWQVFLNETVIRK